MKKKKEELEIIIEENPLPLHEEHFGEEVEESEEE